MPLDATLVVPGLYLVLSYRVQKGTYHWLLVTTSDEVQPICFHAAQIPGWHYETKAWDMFRSQTSVIGIKIGKYISANELNTVLAPVPMTTPAEEGDVEFTCRIWVRAAIRHLNSLGMINCPNIDDLQAEANRLANMHAEDVALGRFGGVYVSSFSA
ncbi:hypothetical protein CALCODRAFT_487320 [Calocera cornea HHB12733]|uniref:Uncharacterized protein n=1 Tax=Calocera cornea HHB12733 TaxID=1353952 RepID=A0A165C478_9BASI|nr:hypothetical protein CALCODRAFT_488879 [Calocera cornea HHB12733]KZT52229.1 hypothetical protein CALCODRAFT_487320 [Calocera cornea HHB12733]